MIYTVVEQIKVKTPQGEAELYPQQLINIDPSKAQKLVEMGKLTPHVTEGRCASLTQCMDAIWDHHALPLYRQGFRMTPAIERAEKEVERLQAEVVQGKHTLEEYRTAVTELSSQIRKVNLVN